MSSIFIVPGYGTPKDIFKDEHYNLYLKIVFNKIWDICKTQKVCKPVLIFSGGKTSAFDKNKTEAGEMIRFFKKSLIDGRPFIKKSLKNWRLIPEKKAISTLENLINAKEIINKKIKNVSTISIFCEYTRQRKLKLLSKEVFAKTVKIKIFPIDFDTSPLRFLPLKDIREKENRDIVFLKKY